MSDEKKDFVIKDRRFFSEEQQEEATDDGPREAAEEPPAPEDGEGQEPGAETQLPEMNFATFIFSLNSSALVHLGVIDDPATGRKQKNLAFAKQTIDILGMMEEKTSGNLSTDEDNLLKNILRELRLMYVREKA